MVCDEPVSALDVSIQAQILNLLKTLQRELGLSYVFIAHNMGVVEHISDRAAVMYLGCVAEITDRARIFAEPRHPYAQALLSAVPIPNPELRRARGILGGDVPSRSTRRAAAASIPAARSGWRWATRRAARARSPPSWMLAATTSSPATSGARTLRSPESEASAAHLSTDRGS